MCPCHWLLFMFEKHQTVSYQSVQHSDTMYWLLAGACVCCVKFSRNKRKLGMLGQSSGNHDWLLANASACVSCGFRLRNARNASDCVWMETGLYLLTTASSLPSSPCRCWAPSHSVSRQALGTIPSFSIRTSTMAARVRRDGAGSPAPVVRWSRSTSVDLCRTADRRDQCPPLLVPAIHWTRLNLPLVIHTNQRYAPQDKAAVVVLGLRRGAHNCIVSLRREAHYQYAKCDTHRNKES